MGKYNKKLTKKKTVKFMEEIEQIEFGEFVTIQKVLSNNNTNIFQYFRSVIDNEWWYIFLTSRFITYSRAKKVFYAGHKDLNYLP